MSNFREVNNDILKEWFDYREDTYFCNTNEQDKKYEINLDEIGDRILKNVPKQNQKYVKSQLDLLDKTSLIILHIGTRSITGMDFVTEWR